MGGVVSSVTDAVGDVTSGLGDAIGTGVDVYKQIQAPIFDNAALIGTGAGYALGGAAGARLGGMLGGAVQGSLGGSGSNILGGGSEGTNASNYGNLLQGLLGTASSMQQNKVSQAAAEAAQRQALAGGQTAANMAAFKPVGTTTRFGTSNFQFDPTTGQLVSAGYNPSALAQGYQNQLAGMTNQGLLQGQTQQNLATQYLGSQAGQPLTSLGQQYLGESPEAIRQRYVQQQTALTAPGNEQALAGIRNNLFQTGRQGLATGATSAGGLAATNPEMAAYYNSLANQQRQIAAGADTAAQQQAQFGAGLYGTGLGLTQQGQQFGQQLGASAFSPFTTGFGAQSAVEQAAQQPLTLSSELAKLQATAGANQGQLYNTGAQRASVIGMYPEMQTSNTATILGGLASPTSGLSNAFSGLGGLFSGWGDGLSIDTSGYGLGSWGGVDTGAYGGAGGLSIR